MTEQDKIADYWADWLIDAVGGATQNRALLRGDPAEDEAGRFRKTASVKNAQIATARDGPWWTIMADVLGAVSIGPRVSVPSRTLCHGEEIYLSPKRARQSQSETPLTTVSLVQEVSYQHQGG